MQSHSAGPGKGNKRKFSCFYTMCIQKIKLMDHITTVGLNRVVPLLWASIFMYKNQIYLPKYEQTSDRETLVHGKQCLFFLNRLSCQYYSPTPTSLLISLYKGHVQTMHIQLFFSGLCITQN